VATDLAFNLILREDQLPHAALSNREYLIFRMIARGEALNDIASRLNLSAKTVSTYKARVMQKMHMASVAELIRYGLQHGLLDEVVLP
jgi:DNA-binding NarL/FixJ family response regulator